jgi:hypothetical protein
MGMFAIGNLADGTVALTRNNRFANLVLDGSNTT